MWLDSQVGNQEVLGPTEVVHSRACFSLSPLQASISPLAGKMELKLLVWDRGREESVPPRLLPCWFGLLRRRTKGSQHSFTP